jgi:hypothetical protein
LSLAGADGDIGEHHRFVVARRLLWARASRIPKRESTSNSGLWFRQLDNAADGLRGARISYDLVPNRSGKLSAENLRLG